MPGLLEARRYQETHPFIDFRLDLSEAPARLWEALGEAVGQCRDLRGMPLRPEVSSRLLEVYMIKGVAATTAIEGNTLDEAQVARLVRNPKDELLGPPEYQQQEVRNSVAAFNWIYDTCETECRLLTPDLLKKFNGLLLEGVDNLPPEVVPGEFRTHSVGVPGYNYLGAPAEDCPYLVARLCDWLRSDAFQAADPHMQPAYSIIKAIVAHIYLAWIHPFGDGNGRVARLTEFHCLNNSQLPKIAIHLFSEHYYETRAQYYRELDFTHRSGGNLFQFLEYSVRGFCNHLQTQLQGIRADQWKVTWEHYIHSSFQQKTETSERQKWLVLDIRDFEPIEPMMVPALSARLRKAYKGKTPKTVTRDINKLREMGLLELTSDGLRTNREALLPFAPPGEKEDPIAAVGLPLEKLAS